MILYETKFLTLKAAKRPGLADWVYVCRPNAKNVVIILPILKKHGNLEVLFLKTRRPPLQNEGVAEFCIELPAGLVGDENLDETICDALKKELLEETGFAASNFEICSRKVSSSSGLTSETSVIAIAHIGDCVKKAVPISDNGIIAERICVKVGEIKDFLKKQEQNGCAISSQTLAALFYFELRLS